jgi:tetratricopeptide (TPR) repeat protein
MLIRRTEGNPFFLEESVRALVETGALEGERGAYRLTTALTRIEVPATVQAILAARIDRLPPQDKRLLQVASVVGKDAPWVLLQAIADLPDDALQSGLGHLQTAEFLYETGLYPEPEYIFKHALTHEVAYGGLLHERRRELHARIMDAIEARYPGRLAEHIDRLAYHASRAERWDKAVEYLHRAGTRAADRSAHRAAIEMLEQALAALDHLPATRETLRRGLDVRFDLFISLFALSEYVRMRRHMEAGEQSAITLGDRHQLGRALSLLSPSLRVTGELRRSVEVGRRALAIAAEVGDKNLEMDASFWLGQALSTLGDYLGAEECFRRVITPLPLDLTPEVARALPHFAPNARAWLASSLAELGRFDEGLVLGTDALRLARTVDDKFRLVIAHYHLGRLHLRRGALANAVACFEEALSIGQTWDINNYATGATAELAVAYARSGRIKDALERVGPRLASLPLWRAEVDFLAGQPEEALETAEQALTRHRQREERGLEGWTLRLLGEIVASRDPLESARAEGHYREALAIATELGMRPLVAHCHLGLGRLYRRTGDHVKATEHLTTAATMYRDMGMTFWLEKLEAEPGSCRGTSR